MKRYALMPDSRFGHKMLEVDLGDFVKYEDAKAAIKQAVLAEREACAVVAEQTMEVDETDEMYAHYGETSALNIRARSTP